MQPRKQFDIIKNSILHVYIALLGYVKECSVYLYDIIIIIILSFI